jgi:hypothetical protein
MTAASSSSANKARLRRIIVWGLAFIALAVVAAMLWSANGAAPDEATLIARFRLDKAEYEQLRDMLLADSQLQRLADWGIQLTGSPTIVVPPSDKFPEARYKKYMELLSKVGGLAAYRSGEPHPKPCILVHASGWAGDTKHVSICWLESEDSDPVAKPSEKSPNSHGGRHLKFKRIEESWYLQSDE